MAPSIPHAVLVHLLTSAPALVRALAVRAGAVLPDGPCVLASSEFTTMAPAERRADAVVVVGEGEEQEVLVGEVQLRIDRLKVWTWPEYVVSARSRHRCPARLVVLAMTPEVAAWAREAVADVGMTLHTIVIEPHDLPIPAPDDDAPLLAERLILAALVHGQSARAVDLAQMAPRALLQVDEVLRAKYLDVLFALLQTVAHDLLRELMMDNYEFQDPWLKSQFEKAYSDGEAHSLRESLRELCALRSVEGVDAVLEAADAPQLRAWLSELFRGAVPAALRRH